jgi:AcrR family transcriptional regulator
MDNVKRRERTAQTSQKPRPRNPAATREALMTAAARIFNREGYFATDTNAIARAAGYAPASFYKHFADKAAILLAVYEDYVRREWAGLEAAMAGETALQKRLRRALGFIIGFHGDWSAFRTTLRAVARIEPAVAEALKASRARQIGYLAAATGLSAQRHRATLLMILGIVERFAETVLDAEATSPPIRREVLLEEAERALLALVERK